MTPSLTEKAKGLLTEAKKSHPSSHIGVRVDYIVSICEELIKVKEQNKRLRGDYSYLHSSVAAILETEEFECRGDEDCDHCVLLNAQEIATDALAQESSNDNG